MKKAVVGNCAADASCFDPNGFNAELSREGHLTIARRFNAGLEREQTTSPGGTTEFTPDLQPSLRPVATRSRL